MEQQRHRLTKVGPQGQRDSVDQNTLKRSDLDDFVSCYFGWTSCRSSEDAQKRVPPGNRHDPNESEQSGDSRRQSERFKSFTYEELTKRDKVNLDIMIASTLPRSRAAPVPRTSMSYRSHGLHSFVSLPQSASRPSRLIRRSPAAQLWLKDEALEDSANLPAPEVIGAEIVEDLEAALQQFVAIANDVRK